MKNRMWTMVAAGVLGAALIGGPAMAQGRGGGYGNRQCNGTGQRIQQRLRDGSGMGRQARGGWQGQNRGNGLRLRDGSGPNPDCPLKK
jgi:hypothetical protein